MPYSAHKGGLNTSKVFDVDESVERAVGDADVKHDDCCVLYPTNSYLRCVISPNSDIRGE